MQNSDTKYQMNKLIVKAARKTSLQMLLPLHRT